MRVNPKGHAVDERTVPDDRTCVARRWPRTERTRRRDAAGDKPLTADFDPSAAVALGNGCYRMRAARNQ
jgi:hypothetical protein